MRQHTGQVSLPGGRVDAGRDASSRRRCARRTKKWASRPARVGLLGRLTPLHIPVSHHLLHPVVGVADARPAFRVAEAEVERLIEVPLRAAARPRRRCSASRGCASGRPVVLMDVPYFAVDGAKVWGATAMILAEFLALLDGIDLVPPAGR